MKQKLNVILTLLLAFVVQVTFAQEMVITGKVTDAQGLPLPGVNVFIDGTNRGTQTDFEGEYSIQADRGETLIFSYIGFATQEYIVGDIQIIDVVMERDAAELEEVMVVGYSSTTKKSFTGTATVISGENIQKKITSDVSQALAGEAAGVQVINTSGQPGSVATIRIRGIGSVNGNRDPLYVVDGVPYSGSLNAINPNDIESTVILKDASATAIYGARGANGVIVINTKDGEEGTSQISVDISSGQNFSLIPRSEVIEDPDLYLELSWEALYNRGVATGAADPAAYASERLFSSAGLDPKYNFYAVPGDEIIDPATGMVYPGLETRYIPEDWEEYAFQPSNRTEVNLSISGGSEKSTYYTSLGYLKDIGYSINSDFERFVGKVSVNHEITDWLNGSMDMNFSRTETNALGQSSDSNSVFWFTDNIPPIYPLFLRDEAGNMVPDPYFGGFQYDFGEGRGFGALTNSIAHALQDVDNEIQYNFNNNTYFEVEFTDFLTFETRLGVQYYNENFFGRGNPFYGGSAGQNGSVFRQQDELLALNFLQLLRYEDDFGDHSFSALVAHESNSYQRRLFWGSRSNLVVPDATELNQGVVNGIPGSYTLDNYLESYFGQVNYDFNDTYFITATARRDGSSRFVKNKWDNFASVGVAWVPTNEEFLEDQELFSYFKLKASYGTVGDQGGVSRYAGYNLYNVDNLNDEIALSFRSIGNPDLTWETKETFQIGTEFTLGNNILEGAVDYYRRVTKDLIFDRREPISLGYAVSTVNDGRLLNSGVEVSLTAHVLNGENYYFDVVANAAFMHNELLNLPIDPATGEEKVLNQDGIYGQAAGHSIFDFYIREWAGVDPATGTALWNVYYTDANGNGEYDGGEGITNLYNFKDENPDLVGSIERAVTDTYADATQKFVGKSAFPDARGAFTLVGGWGGFDVSAQFLYQVGGYAYNGRYANLMHNDVIGGNNWHMNILNRWQEPGDITGVPRLSSNLDPNVNSVSTRFLMDASYLSLNNVRVGYTFPIETVDDLGMSFLNVYVSGSNLFMESALDGFNPSTSETGASSTYRYSPLSSVTAGLRVTF